MGVVVQPCLSAVPSWKRGGGGGGGRSQTLLQRQALQWASLKRSSGWSGGGGGGKGTLTRRRVSVFAWLGSQVSAQQ